MYSLYNNFELNMNYPHFTDEKAIDPEVWRECVIYKNLL